jgi:glycosyltransferase involved in cell wall biosynthesis
MAQRVSIITPSFNQLEWLKLCAASVADQSEVDVEHIIQDAGTGDELEAWATKQPKVKLFVERDAGMYDAINRGLRRAQGDICAYLNCDEQYLPGTLRKVVEFFDAHPAVDALFGDAVLVDDAGMPLSYRRAVIPGKLHTRLVHLNTLSCATFFRRSIMDRGMFFDPRYRVIGDAVWVHRLLHEKTPMSVLREPLAIFTFTGANLGAGEKSQREMDQWRSAPDAPPAWLKLPAILHHRCRKFLAGAYLPRGCRIQIYTRDSPHARKEFHAPRIGHGWPATEKKFRAADMPTSNTPR